MNKLKKISTALCGGIFLFGTISLAKTGIVNAPNGLVLRETASKSANPITTVSDEEKVEILEENGEWYKVKYGRYEGYMFAEYVNAEEEEEKAEVEQTPLQEENKLEEEPISETNTEQKEIEKEESAYPKNAVLNSNIDIYIIPSVTSKIMMSVEKEKTITINYELNDWVNVTFEGKQGWVRKFYIENTQPTEPEKDNKNEEETKTEVLNKKGYVDVSNSANVRETASTSANIITTLLRNTEVTIIGEEGDFYKIQYKDITGYISKTLISDKAL